MPNRLEQPGLLRYVSEGAVTVIAVQRVLTPRRNKEIFEPVVVIIAHANTTGPAVAAETSLVSYVSKGAVAVIFVQPISGVGRGALKPSAV